MKKVLCFILAAIMMLNCVGCGSETVEGAWMTKGDESQHGYSFDTLLKDENGEKVGYVSILPSTTNYFGVRYMYRFVDDNTIQITEVSPSLDGNAIEAHESEYDVLVLETEDNEQVLVSTMNEDRYYFTEGTE